MADAADLKSAGLTSVWVRLPPALQFSDTPCSTRARSFLFCVEAAYNGDDHEGQVKDDFAKTGRNLVE